MKFSKFSEFINAVHAELSKDNLYQINAKKGVNFLSGLMCYQHQIDDLLSIDEQISKKELKAILEGGVLIYDLHDMRDYGGFRSLLPYADANFSLSDDFEFVLRCVEKQQSDESDFDDIYFNFTENMVKNGKTQFAFVCTDIVSNAYSYTCLSNYVECEMRGCRKLSFNCIYSNKKKKHQNEIYDSLVCFSRYKDGVKLVNANSLEFKQSFGLSTKDFMQKFFEFMQDCNVSYRDDYCDNSVIYYQIKPDFTKIVKDEIILTSGSSEVILNEIKKCKLSYSTFDNRTFKSKKKRTFNSKNYLIYIRPKKK